MAPAAGPVSPPTSSVAPSDGFQFLCQGKLVSAEVDRALYGQPSSGGFGLRFRVRNKTARRVGLDRRAFWGVLYPLQWGFSASRTLDEIRGRRPILEALSESASAELRQAHRDGKLTFIDPFGFADYYRASNGACIPRTPEVGFLHLTIYGRVSATDGEIVDDILPASDATLADLGWWLILEAPLRWKAPPAEGWVVR